MFPFAVLDFPISEAALHMFTGKSRHSIKNIMRRESHKRRNAQAQTALTELEKLNFEPDIATVADPTKRRKKFLDGKLEKNRALGWSPDASAVERMLSDCAARAAEPPPIDELVVKPPAKVKPKQTAKAMASKEKKAPKDSAKEEAPKDSAKDIVRMTQSLEQSLL